MKILNKIVPFLFLLAQGLHAASPSFQQITNPPGLAAVYSANFSGNGVNLTNIPYASLIRSSTIQVQTQTNNHGAINYTIDDTNMNGARLTNLPASALTGSFNATVSNLNALTSLTNLYGGTPSLTFLASPYTVSNTADGATGLGESYGFAGVPHDYSYRFFFTEGAGVGPSFSNYFAITNSMAIGTNPLCITASRCSASGDRFQNSSASANIPAFTSVTSNSYVITFTSVSGGTTNVYAVHVDQTR